jgi:carbon-monoxide dehydrogenase large subunit
VRSGGEGGTTPALAAVINAIVDALSELRVRHIWTSKLDRFAEIAP